MAKKKVFQISNALTEGLEETITAAHGYSGELRVDIIPIKKIEVDPDNPRDLALTFDDLYRGVINEDAEATRKTEELASLQTLANSIRDQGIINPIVVYKFGEKYRLVAGERRTLASILAGKSEIQAKILDNKPNDLKISLLQWIENVERTDLTLWERLRNLEKIVRTYAFKRSIQPENISVTELSQLIGCTKPHAMNYKAVLMSDDALKDLIRANKIKNLEKAALIATTPSDETKRSLINISLAGASLKRMRLVVEQENKREVIKKAVRENAKRGRQASSVNFGATKNPKVAKVVLESVSQHDDAAIFSEHFAEVDWNDYQSMSNAFKKLLTKLEEWYA